jgi:GAF domain-containing protein
LTIGGRPDYWPARAAHLAGLVSAEALAIVVLGADGERVSFVQHNLPQSATPGDIDARPLPIRLADGRDAGDRLVVPLIWNDRVVGSVIALRVDRPWSPESVGVLARSAALVALDLDDTHSLWDSTRTAARLARRVRVLEEVRREIAHADDPEKMIAVAAERIGALFGAFGVSVMVLENDDELVVRSAFGANEQIVRAGRRRVGEGISGWVARHGEPLVLSGRIDDARFVGIDPTIEEALVVPLRNGSRVLGVVNVRARRAVGTNHGELLQDLNIVAQDLAAMIERAEAAVARLSTVRRLEADRRQAVALFDLARLAGGGSDAQVDLRAALSVVAAAFRHDVVGIWTPTGDPRRLQLRAEVGYGEVLPRDVRLDDDELAAAVVQGSRPRHLRGARGRAWTSTRTDEYLLLPIRVTDESNGVLVLGRVRERYADIDMDIGLTIADFLSTLAQADRSARLLEESKAERKQLIDEMQQDFAAQLSRVVMVLDLTQRLLRADNDLPTQVATAAREARSFLGRFGAYVADLQEGDAPALIERIPLLAIEKAS